MWNSQLPQLEESHCCAPPGSPEDRAGHGTGRSAGQHPTSSHPDGKQVTALTAAGGICSTARTQLAHCRKAIFRMTSARCTLTTEVSAALPPTSSTASLMQQVCKTPVSIWCEGEMLSHHPIPQVVRAHNRGDVMTALPSACSAPPEELAQHSPCAGRGSVWALGIPNHAALWQHCRLPCVESRSISECNRSLLEGAAHQGST